ncbi:FUSC family protein [Kordia zhangzhouensis]|uniref:FUSC family protein n=1 Tax=Kordia zhangzhouensis TaxID=1620405 RepID=UPI0006296097|nr:FUSC family protein [Kordia zhangzhouensis]
MEDTYSILKEHMGDMISESSMAEKLIQGLEARQKATLDNLPKYGKWSIIIGIAILVIGITIQILTGTLPNEQFQLINSLKTPTIGGILTFFFTIIAFIINAVFAVWAVSFIPYFAYKSYKASRQIKIPLRTNSSKWIQLFASVFLPIIAFSIFASNVPTTNSSFLINLSFQDFLTILIGALVTWGILYVTVKFIPLKYIVVHLTIYSLLLYAVIFFAYILGFGTITYGAVLGMMLFLMFSSNKLGEITRRISIYDIDSNIADKLTAVSNRENTIKVKEAEADVGKLDRELGNRVENLKNEEEISKQLQQIKTSQLEINSKVGKTKLDIFNKKLDLYNRLFTIISEEYEVKVNEELPDLLGTFKENVKNMSAKELGERMDAIINQVNSSLDSIPKGLDNLRLEMKKATKELKDATQELKNE